MAITKLGSSRILREIGRGGMSVVYEAYQDGLDRRVAVKMLDISGNRPKEMAERFRREGRAYAQISNSAVVAVYDLVEKDEKLYLITEFVDGADLQRLMNNGGPLPAACVAAIGARIADGLDGVHGSALLHRDVKPPNVMVSRRGDVKLMDLGIAKESVGTDLTRTGFLVGTPAYVAPEVLNGSEATERSDIWSLGVTLYELATGRKPFAGSTFSQLFASVRTRKLAPVRTTVRGVPRRLARAIERCLEKRPEARWETAGMLARELEACAADLLGNARPQDLLARLVTERLTHEAEGAGPFEPLSGAGEDGSTTSAEANDAALATIAAAASRAAAISSGDDRNMSPPWLVTGVKWAVVAALVAAGTLAWLSRAW